VSIQSTRLLFTNLLENPHGDIRFMLDNSVLLREISGSLEIIGWAVHRKHKIEEVTLTSENEDLATAKLDIFRPLVSKHFDDFHNSGSAGFKLVTPTLPKGKFFLRIVLKNGKIIPIAEFELTKCDHPKLLFMHIAKAAGSTVNSFFASHYRNEQYAVHIESNEKWRSSPDDLNKLHFLSGHIHLHALAKKLNLDDYYKVTVVREPFEQLRSHLSWIRKLSDPGEDQRFRQHPTYIQNFSAKLAKVDLSNPKALKEVMESLEDVEMQLVDNCQVRYFTQIPAGEAVNDAHPREAINASKVFDEIGTTDRTSAFLKEVASKMEWPEPDNFTRENITQNFYGLDTSKAEIRAVLEPYVRHDLLLYDHVRLPT
jgi:hypothetical protein